MPTLEAGVYPPLDTKESLEGIRKVYKRIREENEKEIDKRRIDTIRAELNSPLHPYVLN